ncbi:hypothetical protein PISMIDRAFT_96871, partial [Pisolithus microcarpus 441]
VFHGLRVELTLLWFGIETVLPESVKDLMNMFFVVDNDTYIQQVCEDGVDEALKSCRGIGKSKWHDKPLIGSITSLESCFPFISISNAH